MRVIKNYLISEEELIYKAADFLDSNYEAKQLAQIILKDKQPVETLDRQEVEKILGSFKRNLEIILQVGINLNEYLKADFSMTVTAICNLALVEVSKEKGLEK